jgi:hypothetical protein
MLDILVVIDDEEHERVQDRVAAVDVAKDAGVVCTRKPHLSRPARKRGGTAPRVPAARACQPIPPAPNRPHAVSAVGSWLTPATTIARWWQAWSKAAPPAELQHLPGAVSTGHGLRL